MPEPDQAYVAVEAFLDSRQAPSGFRSQEVGGYQALIHMGPEGQPGGGIALMVGAEGEVYVPNVTAAIAESEMIGSMLRGRGWRPTQTTVALRLPDELGGAAAVFTLWASPKYLAARAGAQSLWK